MARMYMMFRAMTAGLIAVGVSIALVWAANAGSVRANSVHANAVHASANASAHMRAAQLVVTRNFPSNSSAIRVIAYNSEATFLETPIVRLDATLDMAGRARIDLHMLPPGTYAFAVYLDENEDGKLNRGPLGKPTEPYVFSNNVRPSLRKPRFSETAVVLAPGKIIAVTLRD